MTAISFDAINNKIYGTSIKSEPTLEPVQSNITITPEYTRVMQLLDDPSKRLIFVTGGAGSGKSTLIRYIVKTRKQGTPVTAPTGIAALTIGGSTLHSFFKLPVIGDGEIFTQGSLLSIIEKKHDWSLFNRLDLIIIDEISMVRSDMLDAIDHMLRSITKRNELFGGIKMLFVGDLFQLPPITKPKQKIINLLTEEGYHDKYFFNAKCLRGYDFECVELSTSFRHKDPDFMDLLKNIRTGKNLTTSLLILNQQHSLDTTDNNYLTVTARNKDADELNITKLQNIPHPVEEFTAIVEGKFKYKDKNNNINDNALPSPYHLTLKKSAMVMFTKNDPTGRWVNGTIGIVTEIDRAGVTPAIVVNTPPGSSITHRVTPEKWEECKYYYDNESNKVARDVTGSYTQYPLRLAWAITIHKCQSLTLEKISIDLGDGGAFEEGQTYVALSRCTSLSGVHLKRRITPADIKVSEKISAFYKEIRK